jgi:molybdenum cofactor guanylyltransferase
MGTDKAVLPIDGTPMLQLVVAALQAAGAKPIVQLGGPSRPETASLIVVEDAAPDGGPLAGVLAGLRWCPAERLAIVACDVPFLTGEVLTDLNSALIDGVDVAVADSGRLEPLCAVWRVDTCLPVVEALWEEGERAVHLVLDRLRLGRVRVPPATMHNVNRPDDLPG